MNLYQENILDHNHDPRNFGTLDDASISHTEKNPLCGDMYTIHLKISKDEITDVRFEGDGCAISKASLSMLTEQLTGKTLGEIPHISKDDIVQNLGIELTPTRLKCALIGLQAVQESVKLYSASL